MPTKRPDLSLLDEIVAQPVLQAMTAAAGFLDEHGIRHLLVGGLAVCAHGYPRATKDVDFLVAEDAFDHHAGGIVTMRPGLPIQVGGVAIDHLAVEPGEPFLQQLLDAAPSGGLQVIALEALVYMKLKAGRMKDLADVAELIKADIDVAQCRAWLAKNAPHLVSRLDAVEQQARAES